MKNLVPKYMSWISSNIEFNEVASFVDVHIDEFKEQFEDCAELPIQDIACFLSSLSEGVNGKNVENFYLGLVINIRQNEKSFDWVELKLKGKRAEASLVLMDYLTPPNLYLMNNPLDLIFFENPAIDFVHSFDDVTVFQKKAMVGYTECTTLNLLTMVARST